ncbi:MAG: hypothetical protein AAGH82_11150, partial [Pseudomonadota bacterium]
MAIFAKRNRILARAVVAAFFTVLASAALPASEKLPNHVIEKFGQPPEIPNGPLSEDLHRAVQTAFITSMRDRTWGRDQSLAMGEIVEAGDPRMVWLIADLLRFTQGAQLSEALGGAASQLLGKPMPRQNLWGVVTDHLIAWKIAAPPNYLEAKRAIFTSVVPDWERLFVEGDIDWRHVSWGGVLIDDRLFGKTDDPCNCIPAADNPD